MSDSSLSEPPAVDEADAPPRPSRAEVRRAERKAQVAAANAANEKLNTERRQVPCLACLNSATAGQSTGECWAKPGASRYERCDPGGSCRPVPAAALPAALFFLDYVQQDEHLIRKTEKNKRRTAAKVILKGVLAGSFPSSGDPRLA
ncbi:hypothetical protein ACKAV7_003815 [Fusarium commune]|uniref:Uncharacterized protein n=1 Tax=Fusarium oxysporum f. sp. rapae TaxID=485398 RepID=A0A8J5UE40_FUSOX|nr:hypothetical protein Forpe1208_v000078 [Fusarium oxysporum f. sp. rapae]